MNDRQRKDLESDFKNWTIPDGLRPKIEEIVERLYEINDQPIDVTYEWTTKCYEIRQVDCFAMIVIELSATGDVELARIHRNLLLDEAIASWRQLHDSQRTD